MSDADDGTHRSDDASDVLDVLVQRADLDGLVRLIDAATTGRDWALVRRIRDRSRAAVATGRQLWPAATLAEYRLALWAPAEWAAGVMDDDSGRFTIGPLTEVVAQHHTWAELAPLLPPGPRAGYVAHERALRGEVIEDPMGDATPGQGAGVLNPIDVPFARQPWEPAYVLPTYGDDGVRADPPPPPAPDAVTHVDTSPVGTSPSGTSPGGPSSAPLVDDDVVELAVRQLVEPWTASSNGRAEVVCVEGTAVDAIGALGVRRARIAELTPAEALAWLAWAGATGGAMARRRGGAAGRFGAWWTLAALADLLDDWPVPPDELGEAAAQLRWWWWHAEEPSTGWELFLAVEDAAEGYAWAISARDAV